MRTRWVVKDAIYYWVGHCQFDMRQTEAARFKSRSYAQSVAATCNGKVVRLRRNPMCPLCQTRNLVRVQDGYGRCRMISGKEVPREILIPECIRCFKLIVTPAVQRRLDRHSL